MGLGEARRRRQEADAAGTPTGKTTQWGFYTETTDMENYWSELVWQNGGDIISPDHKTSLVGSDQAAGGIQFLQDLIWKDKVMPDAAITDALGDAFEQGQAAMESNGSWLVATHQAAGLDFGIAPLPKGPAGQATSINPTGAVVYKGTKNPDAAWAVRQVPRQPGGPDQAHGAEGVDAGEQGGPHRTVRDVVRRRSGPRRRDRLRPHQALVQGLQRVDDRAPDTSSTRTSSPTPNKTAKQALTDVLPQLDGILAEPVTSIRLGREQQMTASRPPRHQAGRRAARVSEGRWALAFLAPTLLGLAVLSAGPILATLAISLTKWDLLTAPKFIGLDNYTALLSDDRFLKALRNTFFYTIVSVPLGLAIALGLAVALNRRPSAASPGSGPPTSCRS